MLLVRTLYALHTLHALLTLQVVGDDSPLALRRRQPSVVAHWRCGGQSTADIQVSSVLTAVTAVMAVTAVTADILVSRVRGLFKPVATS